MQVIRIKILLAFLVFCFSSTAQVVVDTFYTEASSGGQDAMIASGALKNKNFKNHKVVNVYQKNPQNNSIVFRTLLDFDLSQIPSNAIIVDAKLYLTPKVVNNNHNHPIYIERVQQSWDRNTVKWKNQPSVNHSDKLFFPHSVTSGNDIHEFDIKSHIQKMVSFPDRNYGIRLRLKNENVCIPSGFGIRYHAGNAVNSNYHPKLAVSYVLPIELTATVQHCTAGNDDGLINVSIMGGSQNYVHFKWYKYDMGQVTLISSGTDFNNLPLTNISSGLYLIEIKDDYNTIGYKYVLVGREGETTTVQFRNDDSNHTLSKKYNEDALIKYHYQNNKGNQNFKNKKFLNAADNARKDFYTKSLLKYNVNFDNQLEFTKADLRLISNENGHLRQNASVTNAGYLSRVTSEWEEHLVTWDIQPTIDSTNQITIPETTPVGVIVRNDTFDLLPFVNYWQTNPQENFGVQLELQNYGANKNSRLSYYSYDANSAPKRPVFEVSFTVKPVLEATYDETKEEGTITINAPEGELPYTYLLSYQPIPSLDSLWNQIKDSTDLDSTFFFSGKENTSNYQITGLEPETYYVAVFDNQGVEIYQDKITISPEVILYDKVNLSIANKEYKLDDTTQLGQGVFFSELPNNKDGSISFKVSNLGDFNLGFIKTIDTLANDVNDYLFGITVNSQGLGDVYFNGTYLTKFTINQGSIIEIGREDSIYTLKIDGQLKAYKKVNTLEYLKTSFNILPNSGTVLKTFKYKKYYLKPKPFIIHVNYFDCDIASTTTNVTLSAPNSPYYYNNFSITITDILSQQQVYVGNTNNVTVQLPVGVYKATYSYSYTLPIFSTVPYSGSSEFVVGYPVDWLYENPNSNITETPLNNLTPTISNLPATANSMNATPSSNLDWWYNYEIVFKPQSYTYPYFNGQSVINFSNGNVNQFNVTTNVVLLTKFVSVNGSPYITIHNNKPFLLTKLNNQIDFRNNGYANVIQTLTPNNLSDLSINVLLKRNIELNQNIVSYCYNPNKQYVQLKRKMEGGYYKVPIDDILRVEYLEEYFVNGSIHFKMINALGDDITVNQTIPYTVNQNLTNNTYQYGDNRIDFNVSTLSSGFYILEITNDKNETFYLRFKKI